MSWIELKTVVRLLRERNRVIKVLSLPPAYARRTDPLPCRSQIPHCRGIATHRLEIQVKLTIVVPRLRDQMISHYRGFTREMSKGNLTILVFSLSKADNL